MAVAIVGTPGSTTFGATTTGSFSLDVGSGSDTCLAAGVAHYPDENTIDDFDYAGEGNNLTLLDSQVDGGGDPGKATLAYLVAPATGSNTLEITFNANVTCVFGGFGMTGVNQSSPVGTPAKASGVSTTPQVTVSGATNDLIFAAYTHWEAALNETVAANGGEDERWDQNAADTNVKGCGYTEAGAASVAIDLLVSGGGAEWGIVAVAFKDSGAAPPPANLMHPGFFI